MLSKLSDEVGFAVGTGQMTSNATSMPIAAALPAPRDVENAGQALDGRNSKIASLQAIVPEVDGGTIQEYLTLYDGDIDAAATALLNQGQLGDGGGSGPNLPGQSATNQEASMSPIVNLEPEKPGVPSYQPMLHPAGVGAYSNSVKSSYEVQTDLLLKALEGTGPKKVVAHSSVEQMLRNEGKGKGKGYGGG